MRYNELTQDQYNELLGDLVKITESLHDVSQDVGDGKATIGYGYTFNRSNNLEIWRNSGIELTQEEEQLLADIDAAPAGEKTSLGLTFSRVMTAAEGDQLLHATLPEYERPADP